MLGRKRSLYASKGDIMAWKNKFEKWISVADEIEHNNGRGSEEDLYEHFTKEIVEHVMYTLAAKYLADRRENGQINQADMRTILIMSRPDVIDVDRWSTLVDHYITIFWSTGVNDEVQPVPVNKMEAICDWKMGCSAIHWDDGIPTFTSDQHIAEGLNIRSQEGEQIPRGIWDLVLLEKDHIWPKSKRDTPYVGHDIVANSQWLCSFHNRKWKNDKTTQIIQEHLIE